jgi:hypothetical protein
MFGLKFFPEKNWFAIQASILLANMLYGRTSNNEIQKIGLISQGVSCPAEKLYGKSMDHKY